MPIGLSFLRLLSLSFLSLSFLSPQALAAENVWQSTFGQTWFFESRGYSGQELAGTWAESSLTPGNTYEITFEVDHLNGAAALWVGEHSMIRVDRTGWHSYDFKIWQGSERRMMFTTLRNNTTAGVRHITVKRKWEGTSTSSTSGGLPKGHYLSFSRERNLKAEMLNLLDNPTTAASGWHLDIARDLKSALTTPGVKGFSVVARWRSLETGDGRFDWTQLDANMQVARRLGLKYIVSVATRSFDGTQITPRYFPWQYQIWTTGGGKSGYVAKLWDPYVYNRLIRLYKAIANRYGGNPAFGGIATSETAVGNLSGGNYSYRQYRSALVKVVTETQPALQGRKLFWYLNFIAGGDDSDMRKDARVSMVNSVPQHSLVVGAPDITPDAGGMPGSSSSYRIHLRKTRGYLPQFCHAQHTDQGFGGVNVKSNRYRREFFEKVKKVRRRESQSWFSGAKAIFEFDDLRTPQGTKVNLHPDWLLGDLWNPWELFAFANRNFDCDYFFWHYRENVFNLKSQFWWEDIRPVIVNHPYFYNN